MFVQDIPAIVMELAEGGNLNDFLKAATEPINWNLRMKFVIQISSVLGTFNISKLRDSSSP